MQKHRPDNSGEGRLTENLITMLTSFNGWVLKSHAGNMNLMHSAVMATYHHITSTDERQGYSLCPSGTNSRCRHNAATGRDEPPPKHRYNIPDNVSAALLTVYQRLADKKLLQRCQRGKTQNANEALHSVIWNLAPKHKHASLFVLILCQALMKRSKLLVGQDLFLR